ncbi:MAG: CHAT domain-containing protein [Cyanobacteria bacterium J06560_6]
MARKWFSFLTRIQTFVKETFYDLKSQLFSRVVRHLFIYFTLFTFSWASVCWIPAIAQESSTSSVQNTQKEYDSARPEFSINSLQQQVRVLRSSEDKRQLAATLGNLSLAYQQLSQWQLAQEAVDEGITLLEPNDTEHLPILTQLLLAKGQLEFKQGRLERALSTWETAERVAEQLADEGYISRSTIYQSVALQELGLHTQAFEKLSGIADWLVQQPISPISSLKILPLKMLAFRTYGNLLISLGESATTISLPLSELPPIGRCVAPERAEFVDPCMQESLSDTQLRKAYFLLKQSLELATEGEDLDEEVAESELALGNLFQEAYYRAKDTHERFNRSIHSSPLIQQEFITRSLDSYKRATSSKVAITTQIKARLNRLKLLYELRHTSGLNSSVSRELDQLDVQVTKLKRDIEKLPPSRLAIYLRLSLSNILIQFYQESQLDNTIENWLKETTAELSQLEGDHKRLESYSKGNLARFYYMKANQSKTLGSRDASNILFDLAEEMSLEAISMAETAQAPDVNYEWQWLLGDILRDQEKLIEARSAYEQAVNTLGQVRQRYLLGLNNPDFSFAFRDRVEKLYIQLLKLYLPPEAEKENGSTVSLLSSNSEEAIEVFEKLQVLELENFLRCNVQDTFNLSSDEGAAEQDYAETALIYPILLDERLEILLKLPGEAKPERFTTVTNRDIVITENNRKSLRDIVTENIQSLREAVSSSGRVATYSIPQESKDLYNLIFRQNGRQHSVENAIEAASVKHIVFVLSGGSAALRNLPVAALNDGQRYLVEKDYSTSLNMGPVKAISKLTDGYRVLAAGISIAPNGLDGPNALKYVEEELASIKELTNSKELKNHEFTSSALEEKISSEPFNVLHLATHGKFGSSAEKIFLWAYRQTLDVTRLGQLLRAQSSQRPEPLELLVLSACQTATSDERAVLGLAGLSLDFGARSAIASLGSVPDESTAELMREFYKGLSRDGLSKADALRQAQRTLLQNIQSGSKNNLLSSWASFILVGDWE